jgi:Ca-activated chloride channel family protein
MKRRWSMQKFAVTGAVSLCLCALIGSPRDDRPCEDYVFRSEVRLVLLDVSVKDRAGVFVRGLSNENFDLLENNVSQQTTVFANNDLPATVGILVDESRSMAPKRADVLAAAETFIEECNPRDEIFVLNFISTTP